MLSEDEISRFLRESYPGLVSRIALRLRDTAAAEDVVQEALIRAWQWTARGEAIQSLPAWVTTSALNLTRDRHRRLDAESRAMGLWAQAQPGLLDGREDLHSAEGLSALDGGAFGTMTSVGDVRLDEGVGEAHADLIRQVGRLPLRQRQVVLLYYGADLPVAEIGAALGVSVGTVKRSLFRARQALRYAAHEAGGVGKIGAAAAPAGVERLATPAALRPPYPVIGQERSTHMSELKGWWMAGSHPKEYAHGIAPGEQMEGKPVALVRCTAPEPSGFGTLMQMIAPDEYRGQRVRFSGLLRTADVGGWAGLWMRVDGPAQSSPLAFDNMEGRALKGTTDWQPCEVVLDVAAEARAIGLGVILRGGGEVRIAGLRFEPVSADVPTTEPRRPKHPLNLDFTEE